MPTIKINNKTYEVEIINGERFVDGMPVDEFIDQLPCSTVSDLARLGHIALKHEKEGRNLEHHEYQETLSKLESRRNN